MKNVKRIIMACALLGLQQTVAMDEAFVEQIIQNILTKESPSKEDLALPSSVDSSAIDTVVGESSPLIAAIEKGQAATVENLFELYPAINKDALVDGYSPLHLATLAGSPAIVEILLKKGAKTDIPTKYGDLALHLAIENNQEPIVDLLLESPSVANDLQTKGSVASKNKTPIELAQTLSEDDPFSTIPGKVAARAKLIPAGDGDGAGGEGKIPKPEDKPADSKELQGSLSALADKLGELGGRLSEKSE